MMKYYIAIEALSLVARTTTYLEEVTVPFCSSDYKKQ
jgi:hypothetical protein